MHKSTSLPHRAWPALCFAALLLAGCGAAGERFVTAPGIAAYGPSWGGMSPELPTRSLTIDRVRTGRLPPPEILREEPGNVWPDAEAPRATLADPPRD